MLVWTRLGVQTSESFCFNILIYLQSYYRGLLFYPLNKLYRFIFLYLKCTWYYEVFFESTISQNVPAYGTIRILLLYRMYVRKLWLFAEGVTVNRWISSCKLSPFHLSEEFSHQGDNKDLNSRHQEIFCSFLVGSCRGEFQNYKLFFCSWFYSWWPENPFLWSICFGVIVNIISIFVIKHNIHICH